MIPQQPEEDVATVPGKLRPASCLQAQLFDLPKTKSLEAEAAPCASETAAGLPLASFLSELAALRWQLRDAAERFANEQDDTFAAAWNKLREGLVAQHAFPQPEFPTSPASENPHAADVHRLPPTLQPPRLPDPGGGLLSAEQGTAIQMHDSQFSRQSVGSHHLPPEIVQLEGSVASADYAADSANAVSSVQGLVKAVRSNSVTSMTEPSLKCVGLRRNMQLENHRLSLTITDIVRKNSDGGTSMTKRLLLFVISVLSWIEGIDEPQRTSPLARLINSKHFEALCILVISLNGLFIVKTANYEMRRVLMGSPVAAVDTNYLGEVTFTSFYVIELSLRIFVHRLFFFCNVDWKWNVFDFGLVLTSFADLFTQAVVSGTSENEAANVAFLRLCRVFRIVKIVRVFRAVHFVNDLRMMVDSVFCSFFALFWCIVLILFVLYIFALFFVQSMANFLAADHDTLSEVQMSNIQLYFGSVEVAMVTLFQATTGGEDWRHFYDTISYGGPLQSALFIFYITFFVVAAWNIVTSTFVEKAFKIAQPDIESLLLEKRRNDLVDAKEFLKLLAELDEGRQAGDKITMDEFLDLTENERFLDFFHVRGLDIKDAEMFFRMLASVSDTDDVQLHTFVAGCLRMKGLATSIDLHTLSFETKSMVLRQRQMCFQINSHLKRLDERLGQLLADGIDDPWAAKCRTLAGLEHLADDVSGEAIASRCLPTRANRCVLGDLKAGEQSRG